MYVTARLSSFCNIMQVIYPHRSIITYPKPHNIQDLWTKSKNSVFPPENHVQWLQNVAFQLWFFF